MFNSLKPKTLVLRIFLVFKLLNFQIKIFTFLQVSDLRYLFSHTLDASLLLTHSLTCSYLFHSHKIEVSFPFRTIIKRHKQTNISRAIRGPLERNQSRVASSTASRARIISDRLVRSLLSSIISCSRQAIRGSASKGTELFGWRAVSRGGPFEKSRRIAVDPIQHGQFRVAQSAT